MFVAVAEHLQFTRAAEALGVTVSAASMQIQALERYLGEPLFRRHGRLIELTEPGARLLPRVRQGLGALQDAIDEARSIQGRGPLRISMLGSFLMQWLMPRLPAFEALHAGIELRIETSISMVDFRTSEVHAAIRLGDGNWPGLHSERLLDEWLVAVCHPALLAKYGPVNDPADLKQYRLLHSSTEPWTAGAGNATAAGMPPFTSFDDSAAIVRAAEAGNGLALARWSLVADDVQRGRLAIASKNVTRNGGAIITSSAHPNTAACPRSRLFIHGCVLRLRGSQHRVRADIRSCRAPRTTPASLKIRHPDSRLTPGAPLLGSHAEGLLTRGPRRRLA